MDTSVNQKRAGHVDRFRGVFASLKKHSIFSKISEIVSSIFKSQGIEYIELELREYENIFALILLGSFIGLPSPPTTLSLRLLPYLGRELLVMQHTSEKLDDALSEIASLFDIT